MSGGQKKRVTTGELLVGPSNVLFADEVRAECWYKLLLWPGGCTARGACNVLFADEVRRLDSRWPRVTLRVT